MYLTYIYFHLNYGQLSCDSWPLSCGAGHYIVVYASSIFTPYLLINIFFIKVFDIIFVISLA